MEDGRSGWRGTGEGVREMFTLALSGRGASRLGDGQADPWRCPWGQHERPTIPMGMGSRNQGWSLPLFTEAKRERKREARDPGGLRLATRLRMPTSGAGQPVSDPSLSLPLLSCVTSGHK